MADVNPFDLLNDDGDTEPNIEALAAKVPAVKAAGKKEEPKAAPAKPAVARPDSGRGTRGGRGDVRGRGPGAGGALAPPPGGRRGAPAARGRGRGTGEFRGRGTRGGRGAGRGTYDSSRPRREFDRHDGTGRGYEGQKRGGGGRGNWGAEDGSGDVPAPEEAPAAEEPAEKAPAEGDAAAEEAAPEEPAVEEAKEMSLDEYEALLAEKKAELNKARAVRQIDASEFANLKVVKKDEEAEENPLEVSSAKEKKGPRAKALKEVVKVETSFKVVDTGAPPSFSSDRGGRGGRGGRFGDRGGRGGRFGGDRGGGRFGGDRPAYSGPRPGRGAGGGGGAAINLNAQPAVHVPPGHDGRAAFDRFCTFCAARRGSLDHEAYLSRWFRGADFADIRRGNVEDFVAYGFFYRPTSELAAAGLGGVPGEMVDRLEALWGVTFPPGRDPRLAFFGHLWEPLGAQWRPLGFYAASWAAGWGASQLLRRWGFARHHHAGLTFYCLGLSKPPPRPLLAAGGDEAALRDDIDVPVGGGRIRTMHDLAEAAGLPELTEELEGPGGGAGPAQRQQLLCRREQEQGLPPGCRSQASVGPAAAPPRPGGGEPGSGAPSCSWSVETVAADSSGADAPDWTPFAVDGSPTPGCDSSAEQALAAVEPGRALRCRSDVGAPPPGAARSGSSSSRGRLASAQQSEPVAGGGAGAGRAAQRASSAPWVPPPRGGAPGLSSRTSALLAGGANPLVDALSAALSVSGDGSAGGGGAAGPPPVLFLHGMGGLPAYLELVLWLLGAGAPVIALDLHNISCRWGAVYTAEEVADAVLGLLDKLALPRVAIVGHSYGTIVGGLLLRRSPARVAHTLLIDPVCIGMFMPLLLQNFLCKQLPRLHSWGWHELAELAKAAGRQLIAREVHLSATCARRFYWTSLNLWPEDLAPGSVVLLSGQDDLMDAPAVSAMLRDAGHVKVAAGAAPAHAWQARAHALLAAAAPPPHAAPCAPAQVMYAAHLPHGGFLLEPEVKAALADEMRRLLDASGGAVVGLARGIGSLLQLGPQHGSAGGVRRGAPGSRPSSHEE
ncbi:hypothetical protein HT031_005162 [Scenedesmus sp. PABB004]|nr:hypothetical protein HT031_005162 [Scenedesmus sp. PABB004]